MTRRSPQRAARWKRILLLIGAVVVALIALYPVWLPWGLQPAASQLGLQFQDYHREGYSRLHLSNVVWRSDSVQVETGLVDIQLPHRWVIDRWRRSASARRRPQVLIGEWTVESHATTPRETPSTGSTAGLLSQIRAVAPRWNTWLQHAKATNGTILVNGWKADVPGLLWRDGRLEGDALDSRLSLILDGLPDASFQLSVSNAYAAAHLTFSETAPEWEFTGAIQWLSNQFLLSGRFAETDWLPLVAELKSTELQLPPPRFGMEGFRTIRGQARARWEGGAYEFSAELQADAETSTDWAPDLLEAEVAGVGTVQGLTVERFMVQAPHLNAALDAPLSLDFTGKMPGPQTTLRLWTDLGRIPALPLRGQVSGQLTALPSRDELILADFSLSGTDIGGSGLEASEVAIAGSVAWPELQITNCRVVLDSGGVLSATGKVNLLERNVVQAGWTFAGALPHGVLPQRLQFGEAEANGTVSGAWPLLSHTGDVRVTAIELPPMRADSAALHWDADGLAFQHLNFTARSGESSLTIQGAGHVNLEREGTSAKASIETIALTGSGNGQLRLADPVDLSVEVATNRVSAKSSQLQISGPGKKLTARFDVDWPATGIGELEAIGFELADVGEFLSSALPDIAVPEAHASLEWDRSPVRGQIDAIGRWQLPDHSVWSGEMIIKSDGQELVVDPLEVRREGQPVAVVRSHLPIRLRPDSEQGLYEFSPNTPMQVEMRTVAKGRFWTWMENVTGVRVEEPRIEFVAQGTPQALTGGLKLEADKLQFMRTNLPVQLPSLEDVRLTAKATRGELSVDEGSFKILNQPVLLEARWPTEAGNWKEWVAKVRRPDWDNLTARLSVREAELSELAVLAPAILRPSGSIDVDMTVEPGLSVHGNLRLRDAASRYIPPVGSLRDIHADIELRGWRATVKQFDAVLGSRPVSLVGGWEWQPGGDTAMNLRLFGENLSLVRQSDIFLRADVDLQLEKQFGDRAKVSGDVILQRSFLFKDLESLIEIDLNRPEQRPPFFSIQEKPFADWRLDVRVKGDRFLRVFSPVFKGEISTGLQLSGTLREPIAVGDVTVDKGKVIFPFGTLELERGRAHLSREDPYRPQVDFRGEGQNFGYSITVDITGPVDAANLTFQSVPPLTAQQIFLMLSAGEIPRDDFSYSTSDKASRIGFFVGKQLASQLFTDTSGTERLSLRSGEYITQDGRPTYSVEYKFTDHWSAFGEYNRFSDFNGGLKYKVLSK